MEGWVRVRREGGGRLELPSAAAAVVRLTETGEQEGAFSLSCAKQTLLL